MRQHGAGAKTFHHREVGDLVLAYESVDMISAPGLTLTLYAAEPGSATRPTRSTSSRPGRRPGRAEDADLWMAGA